MDATNYSHGENYFWHSVLTGKPLSPVMEITVHNTGRVRIHPKVDGTWTYRTQMVPTVPILVSTITVNGDGSVIAVGAYNEGSQRGYVDIYRQTAETTWTRTRNNLRCVQWRE